MTSQPFNTAPATSTSMNWTMLAFVLALLVQFAGAVSFAARAESQISELKETTQPLRTNRGALVTRLDKLEESTKPLRDGDLVRIQTDVSWIRERLEKEDRR